MITNCQWGIYNLQEALDNIIISNRTQDLDLLQMQAGLTSAQASIASLGAALALTSAGTLLALDLVAGSYFSKNFWELIYQVMYI